LSLHHDPRAISPNRTALLVVVLRQDEERRMTMGWFLFIIGWLIDALPTKDAS